MSDPAAPQRRSDVVHARLRADILEGRLAAGDPVPSERALAQDLGVNRHAVREALKRLEQAGLVRISQGGATRVQDWRETGGIEVLLDLIRDAPGGTPPPGVVRAVLELRAAVGTDAARRCAERARPEERAAVARAAEAACAAIARDPAAGDEAYAALWRLIVAGSQNLAYRLALNSLLDALAAYPGIGAGLLPERPRDVAALGAAIAARAEAEAADRARALLERDVARLG